MHRTIVLPSILLLALCACLPWADTPFNLSESLPSGAAEPATEFDPSITSGLAEMNSGASSQTTGSHGTGDTTETDNVTTATTDDSGPSTGSDECFPGGGMEPLLVFGMAGNDFPKIAVGPACQIFSAGVLGDWDDCPVAANGLGPAYFAESSADGTCDHVVPLPGQIGHDVAVTPAGAVVVGDGAEGEPQPMVVRVAEDPVPFAPTIRGTLARAVASDGDGIVVTGTCNEPNDGCTGDSLWVARYGSDLSLTDDRCHCTEPYRGRAIAMHEGKVAIVGESRNPGDRTGAIVLLEEALEVSSTLTLEGSGDDLEPVGVDVNLRGAGIVSSTEHGLIVAVSCTGPGISLGWMGGLEFECETASDLQSSPNGNIAIIRLDDTPTIETFGGFHGQHPAALALSDANTLWLAGTLVGAQISLNDQPELGTSLAHLTTDGAGFIARFDLSTDVTTPTGLYVIDNEVSESSSKATDIAFDPDRQRVIAAGAATLGGCLRPWNGTCTDMSFAESRNFLAFLPTSL